MKFLQTWAAISGFAFALTAFAAADKQDEPPAAEKIRATLHERYPNVKISQVNPAPVQGLYELITNAGIAYVDATGDHLILGKILDTKTQDDLTEERWNALNTIPFEQLPLDSAIKYVKGNGKRRFAVFEDPHCPFCRQLETEMQKLTDATIYVFLYPIESLHPGATDTTRNIWCAKDRAAAWSNSLLNREVPPTGHCNTDALKSILALGDKLNINATPTLFFADGRRHAGSMTSDRLDKELDTAIKR